MEHPDWKNLTPATKDIWNENAEFWDDYMGQEGNEYHKLLVRPATEELLALEPGAVVLDVACGNGNFSRRLTELGAEVVAIDFSQSLITRARMHPNPDEAQITYYVIDATDKDQLLTLGESHFDAAVSNMALMDMATIEPLFEALHTLLKPGGRFVFSVTHPCFQSTDMTKVVEQDDKAGKLVTRHSVKISQYITPRAFKGLGIAGQPLPHYYFHRPLSVLLNICFQAGFAIDGMAEPVFEAEKEGRHPFSWINFKEIPAALVVRVRKL